MVSSNYQMVPIQCEIFKIILNASKKKKKKKKALITIFSIHVYINRTNNILAYKLKSGCKLELQTMKQ